MLALVCPLCRGAVAEGSSGCQTCHLPMRDVVRHQAGRPGQRGRALAHAVWVRSLGAALYVGAVWWCALQLPDAMPFVVPGAVLGGLLHVLKGWTVLGLVAFATVVFALPFVLAPALGAGWWVELTEFFDR